MTFSVVNAQAVRRKIRQKAEIVRFIMACAPSFCSLLCTAILFIIMNNLTMATIKSIGRKIAMLRAEQGMSQEDLAGAAEINRGYVSRIENGHVAFSVAVLLKIAEALNVKPEKLFTS